MKFGKNVGIYLVAIAILIPTQLMNAGINFGNTAFNNAIFNGTQPISINGKATINQTTANVPFTISGRAKIKNTTFTADLSIKGKATFENVIAKTVAICGKFSSENDTIQTIKITGNAEFKNTKIKDATINGNIDASSSTFESVTSSADTMNLTDTTADSITIISTNDTCVGYKSLGCITNNIISNNVLNNSTINFNTTSETTVKKQKKSKQFVFLKGKTDIKKIHFDSGKGRVMLHKSVTNKPTVTGGKILEFVPATLRLAQEN